MPGTTARPLRDGRRAPCLLHAPHRLRAPVRQRAPRPLEWSELERTQPERAHDELQQPDSAYQVVELVVLPLAELLQPVPEEHQRADYALHHIVGEGLSLIHI